MNKPICFKVRTQGHCTGAKGGVASGAKGGAGAIWFQDKTFTIATSPDQWLAIPPNIEQNFTKRQMNPIDPPARPFRYLSVFSGMEAASVAWHPLGWTPVGFSEVAEFPSAILKHRFPTVPNHGDITRYKEWPIEPGSIELLAGGSPCQAFSTAGLRKGLADPRGNLALVFLGLADHLRPRWIVWENVPGVLNSSGGRDFRSFLTALRELGYSFAYRVLDASRFGVAQRRRRVYLVAFRNSGEWRYPAAVLSLIDSVRWHSSKGAGKGEGSPTGPQDGVREGRFVWPKSVANTINAQFGSKLGLDNEHCQNAGAPLFVPAIPINTMAALRPQGSDQNRQTFGVGQPGDPQFTLQANHSHAVAFDPYNQTVSPISQTINAARTDANHVGTVMAQEMAVRRITPVEGERLQGFPDNWSRIPWKGKPEEECPDGPRYKAIGNSMAVPCMAWIGRRIALVEKLIG